MSASPVQPRKSILIHQLPPAPTAPGTAPQHCALCLQSARVQLLTSTHTPERTSVSPMGP